MTKVADDHLKKVLNYISHMTMCTSSTVYVRYLFYCITVQYTRVDNVLITHYNICVLLANSLWILEETVT